MRYEYKKYPKRRWYKWYAWYPVLATNQEDKKTYHVWLEEVMCYEAEGVTIYETIN